MSKRLFPPRGANECSVSTPAGTITNAHRYENRNDERREGYTKQKNKREKGGSVGVRQYHYTPGQYIGSSMGVFCAFWSADLQSILDVRICSSALSAREYQLLRVWSLGRGLGREHLGKGGVGNSGPRRALAYHMDFPFLFLFSFIFSSPPSNLHFSHTHFFLETPHVLRFTPSFEVDQRDPLGAKDQDQPGATRCPQSNTTDDAGIGQKRNTPTPAAAVAVSPPSHGWPAALGVST